MSDFQYVDMDAFEEEEFVALPAGEYLCRVSKIDTKTAEGKTHPYWNVEYTILTGEFTNRKLFGITSFHPDALRFGGKSAIKTLMGKNYKPQINPYTDAHLCLENRVLLKVTTRMFDDELRNEVKKIKPLTAEVQEAAVSSAPAPTAAPSVVRKPVEGERPF